jgi:glucosamine-6-phosphate deaminase
MGRAIRLLWDAAWACIMSGNDGEASRLFPAAQRPFSEVEEFRLSFQASIARQLRAGRMKIEVHPSREAAGQAAAQAAAAAIVELADAREAIAVIFATGASQFATLAALTAMENLPWARVTAFHMDEYIGLPTDHPGSFRQYLRERLTSKVRMQGFYEINGNTSDPERTAREYGEALRAANPQLCLLGIGENGHLAFNDPPVADFNDPLDAKVVRLDAQCQQQQLAESWFPTIDDVPEAAISLTIPTLMRVPKLIASVPGPRKAAIVRRTIEEPVSTACPATILRTHPDVTVFLDPDSACLIRGMT